MTKTVNDFVEEALRGFIKDPPDSEYQDGWLASLLNLCREGGVRVDLNLLMQAEKLL